jgi:Cu-Zn family superoxide dismutase
MMTTSSTLWTALAVCVTWLPMSAAGQAAPDGPPPVRATYALIDSAGERVGQVTAIQDPSGVSLQVLAAPLSPGLHGMHLHATGACEPPDFATAGPHYDPAGRRHGRENPDGPHLGDLPNLLVQPDGGGRAQVRIDGVTLTPGARSIGVPGTSLVLHAMPDDGRTDPAGNAGLRIACAVLQVIPSR